MDMKNKQTLADLFASVENLQRKYDIINFSKETDEILKNLNLDSAAIEGMMKNPMVLLDLQDTQDSGIISSEEAQEDSLEAYADLKKRYHYDEYVREGQRLRAKFMLERKDYPFAKAKFVAYTKPAKLMPIDKLAIDYAEQYMICRWLNRVLRRISPHTLTLTFEKLDGEMRTANFKKREIVITEDHVFAPPIDRYVGKSIFDSFLMHSFLNADTGEYEYVPCRLISKIVNTTTGRVIDLP